MSFHRNCLQRSYNTCSKKMNTEDNMGININGEDLNHLSEERRKKFLFCILSPIVMPNIDLFMAYCVTYQTPFFLKRLEYHL